MLCILSEYFLIQLAVVHTQYCCLLTFHSVIPTHMMHMFAHSAYSMLVDGSPLCFLLLLLLQDVRCRGGRETSSRVKGSPGEGEGTKP